MPMPVTFVYAALFPHLSLTETELEKLTKMVVYRFLRCLSILLLRFVKSAILKVNRESPESLGINGSSGLYRKARQGLIKAFTGVGQDYEKPENPELVVKTVKSSIDECVQLVVEMLCENVSFVIITLLMNLNLFG